jgi:hypothetical protein
MSHQYAGRAVRWAGDTHSTTDAMKHIAFLSLAALVGPQAALPTPRISGPCIVLTDASACASLTGTWTLTWDDTTDLALDGRGKACRVALTDVHGALVGRFVGPVLGGDRAAIFTGEAQPVGPRPLVSLVQREDGYTCAYLLTRESAALLTGTWRDSRGSGGTVELAREGSLLDGADVVAPLADTAGVRRW